jgi:hypothetical protein
LCPKNGPTFGSDMKCIVFPQRLFCWALRGGIISETPFILRHHCPASCAQRGIRSRGLGAIGRLQVPKGWLRHLSSGSLAGGMPRSVRAGAAFWFRLADVPARSRCQRSGVHQPFATGQKGWYPLGQTPWGPSILSLHLSFPASHPLHCPAGAQPQPHPPPKPHLGSHRRFHPVNVLQPL